MFRTVAGPAGRTTRGRVAVAAVVVALISLACVMPAQASPPVDDVPTATWRLDNRAYAAAYANNAVFAGGTFTMATGPLGQTQARSRLAAFDAVTGELLPFAVGANNGVRALAFDGTYLYVGGAFTSLGGRPAKRLGRIHVATGAVDTMWRVSLNAAVRALEVSNGSLYAGGAFTAVNGVAARSLIKVSTAPGAAVVDHAFGPTLDNRVFGLAASATVLYAAGNFLTVNGERRNGLAGLNPLTGANSGPAFQEAVTSLAVDVNTDGSRVYLAEAGPPELGNSTESFDASTGERIWHHEAAGNNQAVKYYNGDVYFGFHEGYLNPDRTVDRTSRMKVADAETGVLQPFDPDFDEFLGVLAIDVAPQGVVVGGQFKVVSGVPAQGWALFS